ncbi:MAG: DMT family transporter [Clostridia bacterium]|nr:DMT family transporter [Clostridia bacterium]
MNDKKIATVISPFLLLCTAGIWGFAFVAQSVASELGAFTVVAVRNCFAAIFLLLIIPFLDKISGNKRHLFGKSETPSFTKKELVGGILVGCALSVAATLQQQGMNSGTDPGKSAFISALYVIAVPVFSLFIKKRSPINVWISVIIATVGFYLLCVDKGFTVQPSDLLIFLSACGYAVHIMIISHFSPDCDGIRLSAVQFITTAVITSALALIFDTPISFSLLGENILPLLYLGVASSGVAYTLQIIGQKHTKPAAASLILSLESVFGALASALTLGTFLSLREYIGGAIVFLSVILSQLSVKSKSKKYK